MRVFTILTFEDAGDGLTQSYKIPAGNRAITIQAEGNVYAHGSDGKNDDDYWPIGNGQKESVIARGNEGEVLYFTGDEGAKLYIMVITGLGS